MVAKVRTFIGRIYGSKRKYKIVTLIVFFIAVLALVLFLLTNKDQISEPPLVSKDGVVVYSTNKPSEDPITSATYEWAGGDKEPKFLSIPSISTEGYIQKMGSDQNKQISAPTNIHLAGWFVNSVLPGEKGLSIIDGHVDGTEGPGIFSRLELLKQGDELIVERGDGTKLTYSVLKVVTVPTNAAAQELFSQDPKVSSQLNLITCAGNYNRSSEQYDQRTIVSAALK